MIGCLDIEALGGGKLLHDVWINLGKLLFVSDNSGLFLLKSYSYNFRLILYLFNLK